MIGETAPMVIVDTSIWIEHLREGNRRLERLLLNAEVMCHPFIIGELACGNMKNRNVFLSLVKTLPQVPAVTLDELIYFIEQNKLTGTGIGFVDAHLLASAQLSGTLLWTSDKQLKTAAIELNIAYK